MVTKPKIKMDSQRGTEYDSDINILEDEGEDDRSELVVLDPMHPLMDRVQIALRDQLNRQNEKLEIELRENQETLKTVKTEREDTGVQLYGVQQHLARQQMLLEKEQDNHSTMMQLRKQKENTLADVKKMYQNVQEHLKVTTDQSLTLRSDVDNAAARLHYLSEAHDTVQKDIALTMRATEKAVLDISKAQEDKLKQDLFVDKLTQQIQNLEEQISITEIQCKAQAKETRAMRETLVEATMELEALLLERKKLMQQWNSSLIGMRRRDEAVSALTSARNIQQQELYSKQTELDNAKKSIMKEQERNEQLTLLLHKVEADMNHIKKRIEQCVMKQETLQNDYMTYTRTLQETEQTLAIVTEECSMKRNEVKALRTQIERESSEKLRLEDAMMEKLMQRLTMDKATQYSQKALEKLHRRAQELEINLANVENEIAKLSLESSDVSSVLKRLQQTLDECTMALQKQNQLINKSEADIGRNNALIERKQTQIDQMNKKIEHTIREMGGGEDLGPLEIKINGLQKQISESLEQCSTLQQFWLRQQNELVKKTHEADDQTRAIDSLNKQHIILSQKKIRIDNELDSEEQQNRSIHNNIDLLQKDMARLSSLITKKRGLQYKLEQENIFIEKDFISALKESELEFLQLQTKIDELKEEKERLLNSLVEAEHQIMLWERKIQMAKEMKESVDSEAGQAEIRAMKAEVHRMQVRHSQLLRQQEKLIQEMEKAVYRRETIVQKNDAQVKTGKAELTQGYQKKKISDTKRKIKEAQKLGADCEEQYTKMFKMQTNALDDLQTQQKSCEQVKVDLNTIQGQIQFAEIEKQKAMNELLATQSKVKHLSAVREKRYRPLCKNPESRNVEIQRQKEKLLALYSVIEKLQKEATADSAHVVTSLSDTMKEQMHKLQRNDQTLLSNQ